MNRKSVSVLMALFMALSALSAVSGDGTDLGSIRRWS